MSLGSPTGAHPCAGVTAVEARYLATILDLDRTGRAPTQAEVARAVGVSAPTTLEMIRRLRELGFVRADAVALTEAGTSAALVLTSRRAAARTLAHDVLGLDAELATREADQLASAVSPALGRRLVGRRGSPPRQSNRP
jgi:DtxR family transcriptional regulator, Mn-dependent transcriptional regulator